MFKIQQKLFAAKENSDKKQLWKKLFFKNIFLTFFPLFANVKFFEVYDKKGKSHKFCFYTVKNA
jgi:hypothetical protein